MALTQPPAFTPGLACRCRPFPALRARRSWPASSAADSKLLGAPSGHVVNIREVRLAAGAEFVVMICGDVMTMPGLAKIPSAVNIDVDETGKIVGLSER